MMALTYHVRSYSLSSYSLSSYSFPHLLTHFLLCLLMVHASCDLFICHLFKTVKRSTQPCRGTLDLRFPFSISPSGYIISIKINNLVW